MTNGAIDSVGATSEALGVSIEPLLMRSAPFKFVMTAIAFLFLPGIAAAQSQGTPDAQALPGTIPIFPLGDVVLFPNSATPLHIFEPRYRAMVADALQSDSIIGMVHLQPGYEADYEGRPPIYAIGCAGVIIGAEELPDGRYNIILKGFTKFRVNSEDATRPYRLADVDPLPEPVDEGDRPLLTQRRAQLEEALLSFAPGMELPPAEFSDEEVVDGLSAIVPMDPAQRQDLLEAPGPIERALRLITRLRERFSA